MRTLFPAIVLTGLVACVPPEDVLDKGDSGTQIGSEDCASDLIVITLRDETNTALDGTVVYTYEGEEPVELSCLYTCYINQPSMGSYSFTATVQDDSQTQTVTIDEDDLLPATGDCPAYFEVTVAFEFSGLSD